MPRSLIEQWFPAAIVGAESLRERGASSALPPLNFLHVWWARRPLTASRAAIVASLLPAWPTDEEVASDGSAATLRDALERAFPKGERAFHSWFIQSIGIIGNPVAAREAIAEARAANTTTRGNAYGYDRAFTVNPTDTTVDELRRLAALRTELSAAPVLLDLFSGGGSIPFEATRYRLQTFANELNPVAGAILQGTIALPAQLGPSFTAVLREWGSRWAERVSKRLGPFFPREHSDERNAYIWAQAVPCPKTGHPTPLAPDFWLATGKAGRDVAIKLHPDPSTGLIRTSIVEGADAKEFGSRSTIKGNAAASVWDASAILSTEDIYQLSRDGKRREVLLGISSTRPGGRGREFRAPSDADLRAVEAASAELRLYRPRWEIEGLLPDDEIPPGNDLRPLKLGHKYWSEMFTERQLLTHLIAIEELSNTLLEAQSTLTEREVRALGLYMAFAIDKGVDYSSRYSSWDSTRTKVRNTFDKHDYATKWSFAELDGAAALLPWTVSQVVDAYRGIAKLTSPSEEALIHGGTALPGKVLLGSAARIDLPNDSVDVVVTDPPYYDNVQYAELADYFYVWLKRSLRNMWPEFAEQVLTDKEQEAVANPALFRDVATHSGRGKRKQGTVTARELADQRYEELLTASFKEAHRVLKPDGVMTVMFTHKRVDAWDTLGQALLEAGFEISSSWPVHTESEHSLHQANKNSASSTILLGCRKRASTAPAYWEDIRDEVERAVEEAAERFAAEGIKGVDLTLATYGPALSVLSRHWPVNTGTVDAEGNPERLRPDVALDLARARVATLKKRGLLGGRDVDFDRPTDWWLLAWNDFQAATFPAGEALKLCIATDVELDEVLKEHKLATSSGGNVTLLTPAQRRTAKKLHVDAGAWPSQVDALHALMLTYDEDGLTAAERWLDQTGRRDDQRFRDLVGAALHAVPRTRDGDGRFTRPEARVLDSLRIALFDDIEAPVELSVAEIQGELFDL
jgi:putative DNA methylase